MPAKLKTHDDYLAALPADQRAALSKLRKTIRSTVPTAEERISYGLAAFYQGGKPLVAYGASKEHCGFYLMSSATLANHPDLLKKYETSKGTIRFSAAKPLPATLVRKLVKARIAENAAARSKSR